MFSRSCAAEARVVGFRNRFQRERVSDSTHRNAIAIPDDPEMCTPPVLIAGPFELAVVICVTSERNSANHSNLTVLLRRQDTDPRTVRLLPQDVSVFNEVHSKSLVVESRQWHALQNAGESIDLVLGSSISLANILDPNAGWLPNGDLTIRCRLLVETPHPHHTPYACGMSSTLSPIQEQFRQVRQLARFSNVDIEVTGHEGGGLFHGDACVLYACPYFRCALDVKERQGQGARFHIVIEEVLEPHAMQVVLDFLYTGVISEEFYRNTETACKKTSDLLRAAHFLMLPELGALCENILISHMSGEQFEVVVSGAGGIGSSANGRYRLCDVQEGKPRFKQIDGTSIIYFESDMWKIKLEEEMDDDEHVFYDDRSRSEPVEGQWLDAEDDTVGPTIAWHIAQPHVFQNCGSWLSLAQEHDLPRLMSQCVSFITNHLPYVDAVSAEMFMFAELEVAHVRGYDNVSENITSCKPVTQGATYPKGMQRNTDVFFTGASELMDHGRHGKIVGPGRSDTSILILFDGYASTIEVSCDFVCHDHPGLPGKFEVDQHAYYIGDPFQNSDEAYIGYGDACVVGGAVQSFDQSGTHVNVWFNGDNNMEAILASSLSITSPGLAGGYMIGDHVFLLEDPGWSSPKCGRGSRAKIVGAAADKRDSKTHIKVRLEGDEEAKELLTSQISQSVPELIDGFRSGESCFFKGCRTEDCQIDYGRKGTVLFQCRSSELMVQFESFFICGHGSAFQSVKVKTTDLALSLPPITGNWQLGNNISLSELLKHPNKLTLLGLQASVGVSFSGPSTMVHADKMGLYTKTEIRQGGNNDNRPIYRGPQGKYLYYWKPHNEWRIGDDYNSPEADVASDGEGVQNPRDATQWHVFRKGFGFVKASITVKNEQVPLRLSDLSSKIDVTSDFGLKLLDLLERNGLVDRGMVGLLEKSRGTIMGFVSNHKAVVKFDNLSTPLQQPGHPQLGKNISLSELLKHPNELTLDSLQASVGLSFAGPSTMEHSDKMGLYTKTEIRQGGNNDNRPIYRGPQGKYLYYWKPYNAWRIGGDYNSPAASVASAGGEGAQNPMDATRWYVHRKSVGFVKASITVKNEHVPAPILRFSDLSSMIDVTSDFGLQLLDLLERNGLVDRGMAGLPEKSRGTIVGFVSKQMAVVKFDNFSTPIQVNCSMLRENKCSILRDCDLLHGAKSSGPTRKWGQQEVRQAHRRDSHRSCHARGQPRLQPQMKFVHRSGCQRRR